MADVNYQGIYNRLNGASQYTPLSAETFGDWSMEAGDVVTVTKDGQSYASPVMIAGTDWRGAGTVTVESTGNRKREPLSVLSRKKFSGGGGGYWNSRKAFTRIDKNDERVSIIAEKQTELGGKVTTLRSDFTVMSNRISGSISSNGKIIAEAAIEAISSMDSSGRRVLTSQITLKADKLYLSGDTTLDGVLKVTDGMADFTYGARFGSSTVIYPASGIECTNIMIKSSEGKVNKLNVANLVKNGNSLEITYVDGTKDTFNKAVTLNGAWNNGKYTVTPSAGTAISTEIVSLSATGEPTFNVSSKKITQKQKVWYLGSNETLLDTGAELTAIVDATDAYSVNSSEITITTRGYEDSQPPNRTRIFSSTSFLVKKWYQFDVTVRGETRRFCFYTQTTS